MTTTTKKVRIPLSDKEVEKKGDELAKLELERVKVDQDRKKAARGYRVQLKDLNEQIRNVATDRDTRTEEREFEAERRPNLKLKQYEWHRLDGGGIIAAATRKMTADELLAAQQLTLDDAKASKTKPKASDGNGKAKSGSPVTLVHTTVNKKPKGPAKAQPPEAHPS